MQNRGCINPRIMVCACLQFIAGLCLRSEVAAGSAEDDIRARVGFGSSHDFGTRSMQQRWYRHIARELSAYVIGVRAYFRAEPHRRGVPPRLLLQASDGNCLFRAVSRQLYGDVSFHELVRHRVVERLNQDERLCSLLGQATMRIISRLVRNISRNSIIIIHTVSLPQRFRLK